MQYLGHTYPKKITQFIRNSYLTGTLYFCLLYLATLKEEIYIISADTIIVYLKNPKEPTKKLLELITFGKEAGYQIHCNNK